MNDSTEDTPNKDAGTILKSLCSDRSHVENTLERKLAKITKTSHTKTECCWFGWWDRWRFDLREYD